MTGATYALGDNDASVKIIQKGGSSQRTRWFERATILVKFAVLKYIIKPMLVGTKFMIADIFTKPVDEETFVYCKQEIRNMPYCLDGGSTVHSALELSAVRLHPACAPRHSGPTRVWKSGDSSADAVFTHELMAAMQPTNS